MVARQIGYDPYRAGAALGVEIRVRAADQELQGTIDWSAPAHGRMGERHFASGGRDCSAMLATMGFALAVQIQLMAREPEGKASLETVGTEKTTGDDTPRNQPVADNGRIKAVTASPQAAAAEDLPESSPPSTPWSGVGGGGPSVGLGLGPDPIAQGRLFLSVQFGQAALELGIEASLPSTTRQDYASARHCSRLWPARVDIRMRHRQIGANRGARGGRGQACFSGGLRCPGWPAPRVFHWARRPSGSGGAR